MSRALPKEFRADVVRVARQRNPGVTIGQVAADVGVSASCLQRWLSEENRKSSPGGRAEAAESAEWREAMRRIRLLEQDNEVLRRAAAFLSQANLPGNDVPARSEILPLTGSL